MFQNMPQVGEVIVPGDEEKLQKLMLYLEEEIDRRRKLLSEYGGSLEAYRKEHPESAMPSILIVVDNYPGFAEGYSAYDDMMYIATFSPYFIPSIHILRKASASSFAT